MVRDNAGRAKQACLFFLLLAIIACLSLALNVVQLADPHAVYMAQFSDETSLLNLSVAWVELMQFCVRVAGYVFLIRWFRRAYANIQRAGGQLDQDERWAIWSWFVPLMNFIRPYSIMKEIWRKTQLLAYDAVAPHQLVRTWWISFLLYTIGARFAGRMLLSTDTSSDIHNGLTADIIANLLVLPMVVLTILLVRRVAQFEAVLHLRQRVQVLGQCAASDSSAPNDLYAPTVSQPHLN
jgi:hypothetical protein